MSVVHDLLVRLEEKDNLNFSPWNEQEIHSNNKGIFVFDLPQEIINDFYGLREYIRIANKGGNIRVLSITSSMNGEGSSTIATYLSFLMAGGLIKKIDSKKLADNSDMLFSNDLRAIVNKRRNSNVVPLEDKRYGSDNAARSGRNDILLVDANLNQPSVHRYFDIDVEQGLGEILEQNMDWRKNLVSIQGSNLKIITAGHADTKSVELFSSDRFRTVVRQWRNHFRYVIIDSPPVLTSVEAMSAASVSDGVILIVCAGFTRWDSAQRAKRKLVAAKANLLGVALNRQKMDIPDGLYGRLIA
ncbi:CpsD/CapB family tyrosine-protein kinase [candidate division KSB1 bacterium]|nr:CpsD/CapB family tyrosine-protein kinase [candidate division KSB1 bacterium]